MRRSIRRNDCLSTLLRSKGRLGKGALWRAGPLLLPFDVCSTVMSNVVKSLSTPAGVPARREIGNLRDPSIGPRDLGADFAPPPSFPLVCSPF